MSIVQGLNPNNPNQARVFLHLEAAYRSGELRHPQVIMSEVAASKGLRVLGAVPQSLFDGWDYWIEFDSIPELPSYFMDYSWKAVGLA